MLTGTGVPLAEEPASPLLGEPGATWQHFRGPDGNVYELVAD
jgi:hypothetical protein